MEEINPILLLDILVKFAELLSRISSAVRAVFSSGTCKTIPTFTHTSVLGPAVRVEVGRFCKVELSDIFIMKVLNLYEKRSVDFNSSGKCVCGIPGCNNGVQGLFILSLIRWS